jgi:hypothetical protein
MMLSRIWVPWLIIVSSESDESIYCVNIPSPVLTTNNYYTLVDIHNLKSLNTNLLGLFPLVFTIRFLVTDL